MFDYVIVKTSSIVKVLWLAPEFTFTILLAAGWAEAAAGGAEGVEAVAGSAARPGEAATCGPAGGGGEQGAAVGARGGEPARVRGGGGGGAARRRGREARAEGRREWRAAWRRAWKGRRTTGE